MCFWLAIGYFLGPQVNRGHGIAATASEAIIRHGVIGRRGIGCESIWIKKTVFRA
jgi:hypothetical protein